VSDLAEYEGTLKLGRLCIANSLHLITRYLSANKLTFCTNYWQVGHLRTMCKSNVRKCRICLEVFDQDHTSKCSGNPRCAQCGLDHHSLDPNCEHIQKYRQKLNHEVKQAVSEGTINRRPINSIINIKYLSQDQPMILIILYYRSTITITINLWKIKYGHVRTLNQ